MDDKDIIISKGEEEGIIPEFKNEFEENSDDEMLSNIIHALDNWKNVLLYGPGGTGKTFTLLKIAKYLKSKNRMVCCTATTGVAAVNLNIPAQKISGSTLHSWAGVGLASDDAKKLHAKVSHDDRARKRWINTSSLIIDEVSMLGADLLDKLDYIGRKIRKNDRPFGGIQIIFSGDFLQLPPVKEEWGFNSLVWDKLNIKPFIFEEPKRYDDEAYFQLLLRVRKGKQTSEDVGKLRARVRSYKKLMEMLENNDSVNVIRPTILYSKRVDVSSYNEKELEKLQGKSVDYISDDNFTAHNKKANYDMYLNKLDDTSPKSITLKVGAQVMLKCNLDVGGGLVNGSRGVILELEPNRVFVRFINGVKMYIPKHTWIMEDQDGKATRSQVPFILAWALTIHKGQGCTLDYAICDLGPSIFASGQAYVALSRVRNLKGLFISEVYSKSIKTNTEALEYSEELQQIADSYKDKEEGEECCYIPDIEGLEIN